MTGIFVNGAGRQSSGFAWHYAALAAPSAGCHADLTRPIADIGRAREDLGFAPETGFCAKLAELAEWVEREERKVDLVTSAHAELVARGLMVG